MKRIATPAPRQSIRMAALAAVRLAIGLAPALAAIAPCEEVAAQAPIAGGASGGASSSTRGDDEAALDRALRARRFDEAIVLIERRIGAGDRDPILHYNAACVLAQLGRTEEAESRLLECVKHGFRDFDTMEADADLEPIRASRTYESIMEARERLERDAAGRARRPAAPPRRAGAPDPLDEWRRAHPDPFTEKAGYRYDESEDGKIAFATFLDESSHARVRTQLGELEAHLLAAYFEKPPRDRTLVAIVRPADAEKYLERPEVRGMYLHSARRLVSRDAGQSLQHEFVHLMHFAHMERLGQAHPIWVQEGLASLYEDYTLRADGTAEFHPNVRFNIARRQVVSKTAKRWKDLAALSGEQFMRDAERLYPQARSMFEFLAREGKLGEFYRQLCRTFDKDPDGVAALETTFGEPIARIEERWRDWMVARGAIDDSIDRGDASLGISVEDAADGLRIKSFVLKSAARAAGLRVGDVVIAIDGTPVRNQEELRLAVARLEVGVEIPVKFRRDGREESVRCTPRALGR